MDSATITELVVEHLPQKLYVKDRHSVYVACSANYARELGSSPAEVVGKTDHDFYPPDLAAQFLATEAEVLESGKSVETEELRGLGEERTEVTAQRWPIRNRSGEVVALVGVLLAEEDSPAFQAREHDLLHALLDNMPDNIYFKDRESRFIRVNQAMADYCDWADPEEGEGKSDFDVFSEEHAQKAFADEQEVIRTGIPMPSMEERETWPDGSETWVSTTKAPLRDHDGHIIGTLGISRDITALKRAEQEVQRQRAVLDASNRVLLETLTCQTEESVAQACLTEALALTGSELAFVAELEPTGALNLMAAAGRGWQGVEANAGELSIPPEAAMGDWALPVREGTPVRLVAETESCLPPVLPPVQTYLGVPLERGGQAIGLLALANRERQYTETDESIIRQLSLSFVEALFRKRADVLLTRHATELARSNAELQQFAYVASHDLQEPLRSISGYLQLLQRRYSDQLEPEATRFIDRAVAAVGRMQKLINDLLEYSRVSTRGQDLEPVSGEEILESVTDNLRIALQESGAEIVHDPLPMVLADPTQLSQLLQNLVGNALKFRSEGAPRIRLQVAEVPQEPAEGDAVLERTPGTLWQFSVSDNGIGIDPRHAERIFLIFQRLHAMDEYPGTGIGLAICKKIVERHGGRIWVESQPGAGATFHFTLRGA